MAGTYDVVVDASDRSHSTSASASYTIGSDTTAPSAPSALTATANQKLKQIELTWNPSIDNVGIVSYGIIRNGAAVGTVKNTKWADSTWSPGSTYTYAVTAYDEAGNSSPQSNSVSVKINGGDSGNGGGGNGNTGAGKK